MNICINFQKERYKTNHKPVYLQLCGVVLYIQNMVCSAFIPVETFLANVKDRAVKYNVANHKVTLTYSLCLINTEMQELN